MMKMRYFGHVMRAHQSLEKVIMVGITAGARKRGKPRMWWIDDIWSVTGLSVNNLKQCKTKKRRKNILWCTKQPKRGKGPMFNQGEDNGKPLLWECCLVHPQGSPGVLETRRTREQLSETWTYHQPEVLLHVIINNYTHSLALHFLREGRQHTRVYSCFPHPFQFPWLFTSVWKLKYIKQ